MSVKKRQRRRRDRINWRELEKGKTITELLAFYEGQMFGRIVRNLVKWNLDVTNFDETASDLLHEVSSAALKNWGKFRGNSSVRTWLFKILHYKCVDFIRKAVRNRTARPKVAEPSCSYDGPLVECLMKERKAAVHEAVADLPPSMRVVIEMLVIKEMHREEICRQLAISRNALNTRVCRARAIMRCYLAARGFGPGHDV